MSCSWVNYEGASNVMLAHELIIRVRIETTCLKGNLYEVHDETLKTHTPHLLCYLLYYFPSVKVGLSDPMTNPQLVDTKVCFIGLKLVSSFCIFYLHKNVQNLYPTFLDHRSSLMSFSRFPVPVSFKFSNASHWNQLKNANFVFLVKTNVKSIVQVAYWLGEKNVGWARVI